jgi:hypothetical protein
MAHDVLTLGELVGMASYSRRSGECAQLSTNAFAYLAPKSIDTIDLCLAMYTSLLLVVHKLDYF